MAKRQFTLCVAAVLLLVAVVVMIRLVCRPSDSAEAFNRGEAEVVRARIQPLDADASPIRLTHSAWSTRFQWTFHTLQTWEQYTTAVDTELRRDFHPLTRSDSALEYTRQATGDAFHLRIECDPSGATTTINITFTITAD